MNIDVENLPILMRPKDVQKALGLPDNQINQVYRLFNSKKFPSEKINGKHIIPKYRFLNWLGYKTKEEQDEKVVQYGQLRKINV